MCLRLINQQVGLPSVVSMSASKALKTVGDRNAYRQRRRQIFVRWCAPRQWRRCLQVWPSRWARERFRAGLGDREEWVSIERVNNAIGRACLIIDQGAAQGGLRE
jgi:hypothetical protein